MTTRLGPDMNLPAFRPPQVTLSEHFSNSFLLSKMARRHKDGDSGQDKLQRRSHCGPVLGGRRHLQALGRLHHPQGSQPAPGWVPPVSQSPPGSQPLQAWMPPPPPGWVPPPQGWPTQPYPWMHAQPPQHNGSQVTFHV